jgi:hypothetical protein
MNCHRVIFPCYFTRHTLARAQRRRLRSDLSRSSCAFADEDRGGLTLDNGRLRRCGPEVDFLSISGAITMWGYLGTFIVGLLIGAYLTASYSSTVTNSLDRMHVPLLGHHSSMMHG